MRVISLGWGVQSFGLAAMSALGVLPSVDAAVHADTTHERRSTYTFARQWTPWLEAHGVRVVTVKPKRGTSPLVDNWGGVLIPAYTIGDGVNGQLRRQCTGDWKIRPIRRWLQAHRDSVSRCRSWTYQRPKTTGNCPFGKTNVPAFAGYNPGLLLYGEKTMSKIEWTDETWNPVTGCTKVSPGCKHCYAERMAKRLQAMGQFKYRNGFQVTLHPGELEKPLHWRKPRMVFVCSMSDLFHKDVPDDFIKAVFTTMMEAKQHTFQVLTKRADRLAALRYELPWPENIWAGVSIESQQYLDGRISALLAVPAAVRFVSAEPLLSALDFSNWFTPVPNCHYRTGATCFHAYCRTPKEWELNNLRVCGIVVISEKY